MVVEILVRADSERIIETRALRDPSTEQPISLWGNDSRLDKIEARFKNKFANVVPKPFARLVWNKRVLIGDPQ